MLIEELDVIISAAASIYFTEPLRDALNVNYYGAMRILELANQCKKLEVLTHVSTTYVNSNQPVNSVVKEEIIPWAGGDHLDFIKKVA